MIGLFNSNIKEWQCLFNSLALFIQQAQKEDKDDLKLDDNLNWQFIGEVAQKHRVLPFLAVMLKKDNVLDGLPEKIQTQMMLCLQQMQWQNRVKMLEFNRIQKIFQSQHVPIIPLKGVALTNLVYDQHPFRAMGDIDVLIERDNLEKVGNLMEEHSFQWAEMINRWHTSLFRELVGRGSLLNGEVALDLQWNSQFIISGRFCSLDWNRVWVRRIPFDELGNNVFLLHPDDQISYLSMQILNDIEVNTPYLIQLLDLALVLTKYNVNCKDAAKIVVSHLNSFQTERAQILFLLLDECFFKLRPLETFSESSRKFLELFLTAFQKNPLSFKMPINKLIASPWRRLMFIASYFFPSRNYLKMDASTSTRQEIATYFNYWKSLIGRVGMTIIS